MPVESLEYDKFDYKHVDETPLALEEAVRKSQQLRRSDGAHFHRIVPTDGNMTTFRVESVPSSTVYAEMLNRWTVLLNRFTFRPIKR